LYEDIENLLEQLAEPTGKLLETFAGGANHKYKNQPFSRCIPVRRI
jgi:hypothetical protein